MKPVKFYEVQDRSGDVQWGGINPAEAIEWYRRAADSSIYVSVWDEEDIEEPVLITDKIEVTPIVLATILSEQERR
jgi:hypothetical protein